MKPTGADDWVAAGATAADFQAAARQDIPAMGDEKSEKKSQAQELVRLAHEAGIELFHTKDGETAYATLPVNEHQENWAIRSTGFRRWLARLFYQEKDKPPSSQPMSDAINLLEATAQFDRPAHEVFTRIGRYGDSIYLDLVDDRWRSVEVTKEDWRIVDRTPIKFRRGRGMLTLPTPVRGGNLVDLRRFLNLGNDSDWILLAAWLLGALRPSGPYPVLVLHGEQGSAKSTAAMVVRQLLDPNTAPLRGDPRDARDLMIAASNAWVLAYDNLSHIPPWLSDVFCRLATGGGFGTRELYSDSDEILFQAQRPIILNGIEELVTRGDLLDRTIILYLPPIADDARLPEKQFWAEFEAVRPSLLGALLDAAVVALQGANQVPTGALPRLADFAVWVTAAEPALGWEPGTFLDIYQMNRAAAVGLALEASPVPAALGDLLRRGEWIGTATELLEALANVVTETTQRQKVWPKSPPWLSNTLRRLAPNLRKVGIQVQFGRDGHEGTRLITLRASTKNSVSAVSISGATASRTANASPGDVDEPPHSTPKNMIPRGIDVSTALVSGSDEGEI